MRIAARFVCALVGHQPSGGQATYDTAAESFVDVARTQYATCTRCGDVRPAPLTLVDGVSAGERTTGTPDQSSAVDGIDGTDGTDGGGENGKDDEGNELAGDPGGDETDGPQEDRDPDGDCAVSTTR